MPEPICNLGLALPPIGTMPKQLDLDLVSDRSGSRIWNSLVAEFHYLGLPTPVGRVLRYVIRGDGAILGAISFGECAWRLAPRDQLLNRAGVREQDRTKFVISNNRFVILPQVRVDNLASRILSVAVRRVAGDWLMRFSCAPLFVETFVDPRSFLGTCYKAANWVFVGTTKGFSKRGSLHWRNAGSKLIFLRGLSKHAQHSLLSANRESVADEGSVAA